MSRYRGKPQDQAIVPVCYMKGSLAMKLSKRAAFWLPVFCFLFIIASFAGALEPSGDENIAALKRLFAVKASELDTSKFFSDGFLKAVPDSKLKPLLADLSSKLGEFRAAVRTAEGSYNLIFAKGRMPAKISLDAKKLIAGLWVGNPVLADDDIEKISAELRAIEGTVSVAVLKNGTEDVFMMNPDAPLAVGSAFKLYVLKALKEKIMEGRCEDSTVVELSKKDFSFPTGTLQNWPDKTPLTLRTLAHLMISISDNTATDALIDYLGRDEVERYAPARVRPFLKTIELFKLKWGVPAAERDAYAAAGAEERYRIVAGLDKIGRDSIKIDIGRPILIDRIEWHVTARELCDIISELKGDPSLCINPGLADAAAWHQVGYKGGSEPGVLNYTHILQKKAGGDFYAVSATVNNQTAEVQIEKFTELTARIISLIEDGKLERAEKKK